MNRKYFLYLFELVERSVDPEAVGCDVCDGVALEAAGGRSQLGPATLMLLRLLQGTLIWNWWR